MDLLFHEKQEGSLCAQHCLNSLLQGEYFTAVDLATIAEELDKQELNFMYDGGTASTDYEKFLKQPSSNYDDSGFFSIQVIQKALDSFNLELIPYQSQNQIALAAQLDPTTQNAYICNFKEHWYAIRKFSDLYWFNLNSLFKRPQFVSDTYLSVLLAQLVTDGYSIFIVNGDLLPCTADQNLLHVPKEVLMVQYSVTAEPRQNTAQRYQRYGDEDDAYDDDLKAAIQASLAHDENEIKRDSSYKNAVQSSASEILQLEDDELKRAIELSLANDRSDEVNNAQASTSVKLEVDVDEVRRRRLEFLNKLQKSQEPEQPGP